MHADGLGRLHMGSMVHAAQPGGPGHTALYSIIENLAREAVVHLISVAR
jgi:hypothetical protein